MEKQKFGQHLLITLLVILFVFIMMKGTKAEEVLSFKKLSGKLVYTTDLSLHLAALEGGFDRVQQLIKQGKNVNGVSALPIENPKNPGINPFKTPLHLAAVSG